MTEPLALLDRVYRGLEDAMILEHINRCEAADFELSALDWHLRCASWERLETLTAPRDAL